MAIMYPQIREKLEGAYAEQKIYDALSSLPNDFIIFHSVNWVRKKYPMNLHGMKMIF